MANPTPNNPAQNDEDHFYDAGQFFGVMPKPATNLFRDENITPRTEEETARLQEDSSVYSIQDTGSRAYGSLDQSFFGNGECEKNCVAKVNKTKRPNITLWLLENHGGGRLSQSFFLKIVCVVTTLGSLIW